MFVLKKGSVLTVRYLVKYTKESDIKFISHLDLMRTIQRTIRRSELPIEYSKGFNPHMSVSIAQPLSVGMYSIGEYMDIVLDQEMDTNYIQEKLNMSAPKGVRFLHVREIRHVDNEKKIPQAMAMLDGAKYRIRIKYDEIENLEQELAALLKENEWNILKKSKSGEKMVNIKPLIKDFKYSVQEKILSIEALVACGSRENLSADLLAEFIEENTKGVNRDAFVDIMREELYAYEDDKLIALCEKKSF